MVLLYKHPSDDYFQTTEVLSLGFNLPAPIAALLILAMVYPMLIFLAREYRSSKKLSHKLIADQFKKIVGLAPWKTVPNYIKEYALIVNPDYSISLKRGIKKMQE